MISGVRPDPSEFPLRLFVSEFMCGGGCTAGERPASLVREGAAMLRACLTDLLRIPGVDVVTTWDRRISAKLDLVSPSLEVVSVSGPEEEREVFARLSQESDGTYVIAPELDDELSRRVAMVAQTNTRLYNCSVEAIDLCGDKWALFEHLSRERIPTIPTRRLMSTDDITAMTWPRVLKLRWGAGSQSMQLVWSYAEWEAAIEPYAATSRSTEAIIQPWNRGMSLSAGAIIDRAGTIHVLPTADQHIDIRQGFAYLGGCIPSRQWTTSLHALIRQTLSSIHGLFGYVGVDVLVPEATGEPLIVEINPRLTTSYVGYQKLCHDNLAEMWVGDRPVTSTPRWRPGHVEFDSAGEFR